MEQTFFCAIDPSCRSNYVSKMESLLSNEGLLVGLLFNKQFEFDGPPFGGSKTEYLPLFQAHFSIKIFDTCYNSFEKRAGSELFIIVAKKNQLVS